MLRRGLSPSRPRPQSLPLREGVTACAVTDEGSSFPRPAFREGRGKPRPYGVTGNSPYLIGPDTPSGRAHKDGGRTMCAPTNWPKASRRGGFQPPESLPLQGKVSRRTPRRMRGLPFPVPLFREGRDKLRPYGVTGNSPYLIGPDTPSGRAHKDGGRTMCAPTNWPKASRRGGFQPPEKPSPPGGRCHGARRDG